MDANFDWGKPSQSKLASPDSSTTQTSPSPGEIDLEASKKIAREADEFIGYQENKKRRNGNYDVDAIENISLTDYEENRLGRRTSLEKGINEIEGGNKTVARYQSEISALTSDNESLSKSSKFLERKLKETHGDSVFEDLEKNIAEYNALKDAYDTGNGNDETIAEINRLASDITRIREDENFKELTGVSKAISKNVERFRSMNEDDDYATVRKVMDIKKSVQSWKDGESSKWELTKDIALKSVAKLAADLGTVLDMAETKTVGDEEYTSWDRMEDWLKGLDEDSQLLFATPTQFSRPLFTKTAKWGDYEVDMIGDDKVVRKDGKVIEGEFEIPDDLDYNSKFNPSSAPYQIGEVAADMAWLLMGAGAGKAGLQGAGLSEGLASNIALTTVTAGQMSSELYETGLKMFDGDKEKAMTFALRTGLMIGVVNSRLGPEKDILAASKGVTATTPSQAAIQVLKKANEEGLEEGFFEPIIERANNLMINGEAEPMDFHDSMSNYVMGFAVGALADGGRQLNDVGTSAMMMAAKDPERFSELSDDAELIERVENMSEKINVLEEEGVSEEQIEETVPLLNDRITLENEQKESKSAGITSVAESKKEEIAKKDEEIARSINKDPKFGEWKVDEESMEMYKGEERKPLSGKVAKDYADSRIDTFALEEDANLDNNPDPHDQILEEGSTLQIGRAWAVEPEKISPDPNDKSLNVRDEVAKRKFSENSLGRTKFQGEEMKKLNRRYGGGNEDAAELAQELTDTFGYEVTEEDVFDAMEKNLEEGRPDMKEKRNPRKKELSDRFKEKTGIRPNEEYLGRLESRADKLREEREIEERLDLTTGTPVSEDKNEGDTLRGFYANSLEKAKGISPGRKLLDKVAKANPQLYQSMNIRDFADEMQAEIDSDGIDLAISKAKSDDTGEDGRKVAARRVLTLIAIGDMMVEANRDGNKELLDQLSASANTIEKKLAKRATETGQENAFLAYYSMTPDGQLARVVHKTERRRDNIRNSQNESGENIGSVVDGIVSDLSDVKMSNEDAKKAIEAAAKAMIEGKKASKRGKKRTDDAIARLKKSIRKIAPAGVPITKEVANDISDIFLGLMEQFYGNIQMVRSRLKSTTDEVGLKWDEVWDYINVTHPEQIKTMQDLQLKLEQAVLGIYNGDAEGDLTSEMKKLGIDDPFLAEEIDRQIQSGRRKKISSVVRKHEKSEKKARAIENNLMEGILVGAFDEENIRRRVEEKYGIKSFTNEELAELNEMVIEAKALPGQRKKREKMVEIMDYIANRGSENPVDVIHSFWYGAVLSDLKTWIASVGFSNLINHAIDMFYYGTFTNGGRYAVMNSFERLLKPSGKFGIWFGLSEMGAFIGNGTGYRSMAKVTKSSTLERISKASYDTAGKKVLGAFAKVFRYPMRMIAAFDAVLFYGHQQFHLDRMAYQQALAEGAEDPSARASEIVNNTIESDKRLRDDARKELESYAKSIGKGFDEVFSERDVLYRAMEMREEGVEFAEEAQLFAEEITLQNRPKGVWGWVYDRLTPRFAKEENLFDEFDNTGDKAVDDFMKKVQRGATRFVQAWGGLMFPFLKPFANSMNRAADFFPFFGIPQKLVFDNIRGLEPTLDLKDVDRRNVFLAKQTTGIILMSFWLLAGNDDEDEVPIITADGPEDYEKKSQMYNMGWKPYTIRVGDKNIYYRDSALGMLLSFLGAFNDHNRFGSDKEDFGVGDGMMLGLLGYLSNASVLQQFDDLTNALMQKDASSLGKALMRPVTGITKPGIWRTGERLANDELSDSRTLENKFLGAFMANVAGVDNMVLDFKFNALGEPIDPVKNENLFSRFTGMSKYVSDAGPYNDIFGEMAKKEVYFPRISASRTKVFGREMTHDEKRHYSLIVGRYRKSVLSKSLDKMSKMTKEQLEYEVRELDKRAKKIAKVLIHEVELDGRIDETKISKIDELLGDADELHKRFDSINRKNRRSKKDKVKVPKDLKLY